MRESAKALLALVFAASLLAAVIAWFVLEKPNLLLGGISLALGLLALAVLLRMQCRRDEVPDFLSSVTPRYFERDGFCFVFAPVANDGVCWMEVFFQNKYEHPCHATIRVKPGYGFFLTRATIPPLEFHIECGPAAFGVAHVPWAIPQNYQGTEQKLDFGASVCYPRGRGRILRTRDGLRVGTHKFHNNGLLELLIVLITIGMMRPSKAANATVPLPRDVADTLPPGTNMTTQEIWRLGDEMPVESPVSTTTADAQGQSPTGS